MRTMQWTLGVTAVAAITMVGVAMTSDRDDSAPSTVIPNDGTETTVRYSIEPADGRTAGIGSTPQDRPQMSPEQERAKLAKDAKASAEHDGIEEAD